MRRIFLLIGALVLAHLLLLTVRPPGAAAGERPGGLEIGIVLDIGGRGDKSFNDGAFLGGERVQHDLGAHVVYIEPGDGSDREAGLRLLAAEGADLVIGVGFIFTDDLLTLAREYPNIRFAGIDLSIPVDSLGSPLPLPPNLRALKFREEEGSFLVGALAALTGKSRKVGFVGGMDIALIHKFEAGYRAGVKAVCPDCEVLVGYAGVTPEAFRNPLRGKEIALAMYNQGANVIFHASGSTGLGVLEAARATGKLAIGVDADQYDEAPGYVLTSMVKGIDEAVYQTVKSVQQGTFSGGVQNFGLAEHGVGYVYNDHNKALIPDSVRTVLDSLSARIIDGRIRVPSSRGGL